MRSLPATLGRWVGEFRAAEQAARRAPVDAGGLAVSGGQFWSAGRPAGEPRTHTADIDRYATADDVYSCVDLLAANASRVRWQVFVADEEQSDHDLALLLARGSRRAGGGRKTWLTAYTAYWLTGEWYAVLQRGYPLDSRLVTELYALAGTMVSPVPDAEGYVDHYEVHRPGWSSGRAYPRTDVVPCLKVNLKDPLRGLSPISSVRLGLDTEWQAKSANLDIFRNGMMASSLFSPDTAPGEALTMDQRNTLETSFNDKGTGEGNRHRLIISPTKGTLSRLQLTPEDAQFLEQDKLTFHDVCKVYHVPPVLLGEPTTYANYATARKQLWEDAILPVVDDIQGVLNNYLAPQYGDAVEVRANTEGIEALRQDAIAEAKAVAVWVGAGYDRRWVAERITGDPIPDEALPAPTPETPPSEVPPALPADETKARCAARRKATDTTAIITAQQADLDALVGDAEPGIRDGHAAQCERVVANLAAMLPGTLASRPHRVKRWFKATDPAALVAVLMPTWHDDPLAPAIAAALNGSVAQGASAANTLFALEIDTGRVHEATSAWLQTTAAADVRHVNDTTRELLRQTLAAGVEAGEGLADLTARVEAAFGQGGDEAALSAYAGRARTIAVTETGTGYNHGSTAAIDEAGLNREWLSALLPTTRPEHAALHGRVVAPGGLFNLAGYLIPYPMHASLPAAQRVLCRCTVAATEREPN